MKSVWCDVSFFLRLTGASRSEESYLLVALVDRSPSAFCCRAQRLVGVAPLPDGVVKPTAFSFFFSIFFIFFLNKRTHLEYALRFTQQICSALIMFGKKDKRGER